jgi:hypothetical protein
MAENIPLIRISQLPEETAASLPADPRNTWFTIINADVMKTRRVSFDTLLQYLAELFQASGNYFVINTNGGVTIDGLTNKTVYLGNTITISDYSTLNTAISAYGVANLSYSSANGAYLRANASITNAGSAYNNSNSAYNQANSAYNHANSSYRTANSAYNNANSAFDKANSAYNLAVSVGNQSTTGLSLVQSIATSAYNQANSAYNHANSSYRTANSAYDHANSSYNQANSSFLHANSVYRQANSSYFHANSAYAKANAAYDLAVSIGGGSSSGIASVLSIASSAYNHSNSSYRTANSAYDHANSAYNQANSSFLHANSVYRQANSSYFHANSAFEKANAAYNLASIANGNIPNLGPMALNVTYSWNQANSAHRTGNSAYNQANSSFLHANSVYRQANSSYFHANSAYAKANSAYDLALTASSNIPDVGPLAINLKYSWNQANSAHRTSNSAYNNSNSAYNNANSAFDKANAAYKLASSIVPGGPPADISGKYDKTGGPISGAVTTSGGITINNGSPTLYLQDTDSRSSMVHCNSGRFYVLRGKENNSKEWEVTGGGWPLEIDLSNNDLFSDGKRVDRFPAGTRLCFQQAAAPTGWGQILGDTINNRMMRVVGTAGGGWGGSDSPILNDKVMSHKHSFTTEEAGWHGHHVEGWTSGMNDEKKKEHKHTYQLGASGVDNGDKMMYGSGTSDTRNTNSVDLNHLHYVNLDTWGAGTHRHTGSTDSSGAGAGWTPRYINIIICEKHN